MTERLTDKTIDGKWCAYEYESDTPFPCGYGRIIFGSAIDKLAEYENAEEEGRLVVLPCKVGDIVYKIMCQRDNFDDRPYRIITSVNFRLDMADDIGKTIFLTREEAEKALKEMEDK